MSVEALNMTDGWWPTQPEDPPNPAVYVAAAVVLAFIGLTGFTLNLLVAVVIASDTQTLWVPVNVILLNLVISDFLVAALGNPLATISAIYGGWYWKQETCLWYAWLMSTLGFASIGNLTAMSVERWLLVTRPMKALSIRHAGILAGLVWIYALCLSLPPFFGWGSYGPEAGNVSCSVSWEIHDSVTMSDSYVAYIFALGLALPVTVIAFSYLSIVSTLRKVKRRAGGRTHRETRVTKMVAVMIFAFLLAWSPYAALAIAAQYFAVRPSPTIAMLPALLAKSSICYNPVIYAGLNSQFTRSLRKLLGMQERVPTSRDLAQGQGQARDSQDTALTLLTRQTKN